MLSLKHLAAAALLALSTICAAEPGVVDLLRQADRQQVVLCGTEAHVCVLQTVLDLRWQGKEVFLVADAVGSRKPADKDAALARMRSHGVEIVTREMVAFEWLHDSAGPLFREINRDFIRDN